MSSTTDSNSFKVPSSDIRNVIKDFYSQPSSSKLSFADYVKTNYVPYSNKTLGIDEDYADMVVLSSEDLVHLPSHSDAWEKLYSESSELRGAFIITSDFVDTAKSKYLVSASRNKSSFEHYVMTQSKIYSQPAGWKLFGNSKTPEQKQRDEEFKKLKKESQARVKEAEQQDEHTRRLHKLKEDEHKKILKSNEKTVSDIEQKQKKINELKQKVAKVKAIKEQRLKQQPALANKKPQKIFKWNNDDAYLVYLSMFSPNYLKLGELSRLQKVVEKSVLNNYYLKTRLEKTSKTNEPITEEGLDKLLSILYTYPDHWKVKGQKVPKTQYDGSIKWKDVSDFSLSECYSAYVAIEEICKGETFSSLTTGEVKEVKEGVLSSIKKALIEDKVTTVWNDTMVEALKRKVLEKSTSVSVDTLNQLIPFVKAMCKNEAVTSMRNRIKSYINKNKYPPITDSGFVAMISICRYHPSSNSSGPLAEYSTDSKENNVAIVEQGEVEKFCDYDLRRANDVYKKLKDMVRDGAFPFDSKLSDIVSPSETSKKQAPEQSQQTPMSEQLIVDYTDEEIGLLDSLVLMTRKLQKNTSLSSVYSQLDLLRTDVTSNNPAIMPWSINTLKELTKDYLEYINSLNALAAQK